MIDSLKIHSRWHGFFSISNTPEVLFTKSVSSYSALCLNAVCIVVVLKQQQWWVLLFGLVPPSPRCPRARAGGGECRRHQPRLSPPSLAILAAALGTSGAGQGGAAAARCAGRIASHAFTPPPTFLTLHST